MQVIISYLKGAKILVKTTIIHFSFDGSDCPPPGVDLPEYFSLGSIELSPEMMIT